MNYETLERQVLMWKKMAVLVPILVTGFLGLIFLFQFCDLRTLIYIACGLYFVTAIVWWYWTMKSIDLLVNLMKYTNVGIIETKDELKSIRQELMVDLSKQK